MYSIGEFSKITGLSIKALRLYHEKGLLAPSLVDDDTGYRYYQGSDIEKARSIVFLKSLMFSLAEISDLLTDFGDEADLLAVLEKKRFELQEKAKTIKNASDAIDDIIKKEKHAQPALVRKTFPVTEKEEHAYLIGALRWRGRYRDSGIYFGKLFRAAGRLVCGKPLNLYYDEGYVEDGADIESCLPVKKSKKVDGIEFRQLPKIRLVTLIHKGPYEQLGRSYAQVFDHIRQRNLSSYLPYREIYLKGPGMIFKGHPDNYLTEIQIPVTG